jgi:hypothetical protein
MTAAMTSIIVVNFRPLFSFIKHLFATKSGTVSGPLCYFKPKTRFSQQKTRLSRQKPLSAGKKHAHNLL